MIDNEKSESACGARERTCARRGGIFHLHGLVHSAIIALAVQRWILPGVTFASGFLCRVYEAALRPGRSPSTLFASIVALAVSTSAVTATSFQLNDFSEIEKDQLEKIAPNLQESFPNARFFVTGFSGPPGRWDIIRIEDPASCKEDLCPTVVAHDASRWKVMIKAVRGVNATVIADGPFIQINLKGDRNQDIVIQYREKNHILSIMP